MNTPRRSEVCFRSSSSSNQTMLSSSSARETAVSSRNWQHQRQQQPRRRRLLQLLRSIFIMLKSAHAPLRRGWARLGNEGLMRLTPNKRMGGPGGTCSFGKLLREKGTGGGEGCGRWSPFPVPPCSHSPFLFYLKNRSLPWPFLLHTLTDRSI